VDRKYYELHDFDGVVDSFNYRITAEGVDLVDRING
jgi:hypothetical protein